MRASLAIALVAACSARPAEPRIEAAPPGSPFGATVENVAPPPSSGSPEMVWIPGGEFSMGAADPREHEAGGPESMDDARPIHRVYVDGFFMDRTEVTNEAFERFVLATGYVTVAERAPSAEEFPDAPRANLVAGSTVFAPPRAPVPLDSHYRWWDYVHGASWRHPFGPTSDLQGRGAFPVVQVAYDDAAAYARWAGKRLPTEAEFEFAARGGLAGRRYSWGDDLRPDGKWMANTHQGHFPDQDLGEDGWVGLAKVGSYPPNRYGLYDITGNVWEWCQDWYRYDYYAALPGCARRFTTRRGRSTPSTRASPMWRSASSAEVPFSVRASIAAGTWWVRAVGARAPPRRTTLDFAACVESLPGRSRMRQCRADSPGPSVAR